MAYLHIYYGNGKGKTTSAIGLAIRALGAGFKVLFMQFDKGFDKEEHYSERKILRGLAGLELLPTGLERIGLDGRFRFGNTEEDLIEANRALTIAKAKIQSKTYQLMVMDEILAAVAYKLIAREQVMDLVTVYNQDRYGDLVFTGHTIWPELEDAADLISQISKKKHYFDKEVGPRVGIEI